MSSNIDHFKATNYTKEEIYIVRNIYVIFMLIWFIVIYTFKLFNTATLFLLFIPFILFIIAFINADYFTTDICDNTFQTTFIGIGLLLSIPMLTYMQKSDKDLTNITILLILSMIFILVTYYHIWIPDKYAYIWKHIKSCFETMAVTLFIYVLITYYLIHTNKLCQN